MPVYGIVNGLDRQAYGMGDQPDFLQGIAEHDPDFAEHVGAMMETSLQTDGALPAKTKLLIAMALDAAEEHGDGVASLADQAREQGATEAEIAETIQVVTTLCGLQGLVTGTNAFED
jgi:alkylhydroperoxidase/carboxymuconolactone decarboxylase family protein YurZ